MSSSESKSPSGGGGGVERGLEEEVSKEEDSWKVWSELLRNWEESIRKQQKTVRQRVREGIPGALRGMAWQLMCGAQEHNLRDRYPELLTVRESLFVCCFVCMSVHYCEGKVVRISDRLVIISATLNSTYIIANCVFLHRFSLLYAYLAHSPTHSHTHTQEESPFERQIRRDLARTFPEHSFFKERDGLGQESLLNILKVS